MSSAAKDGLRAGALTLRLLTAAVFVPGVVSMVLWRDALLFAVFLLATSLKGVQELQEILSTVVPASVQRVHICLRVYAYVAVTALLATGYLGSAFAFQCALAVLWSLFLVLHIVVLNSVRPAVAPEALGLDALFLCGSHAFGVMYIGFSMSYALQAVRVPGGRGLIASMLLTSWAADGAAYLVGSRLGRRPLAPLISPKKTVEGLVASVVFALLTELALLAVSHSAIAQWVDLAPAKPLSHHIALAVMNALLGAAGDLLASSLKRAARRKDSGAVFAGHGGVLDRFDTFYVLAPLYTAYALWRAARTHGTAVRSA